MFEAKGDRPQWQVLYDSLVPMSIGDVIEDERLFELLPDARESSVRSAFWRAVKEVEDCHKRTFCRVRLTGYRMVEAGEHEGLARGQQRKARRRMTAAVRKVHSADRSLLTLEQRKRMDALEEHFGRQQEMLRRLAVRQEKTDERVARSEKDSAALGDRLDRLTDLLKRNGIGTDDPSAADIDVPDPGREAAA